MNRLITLLTFAVCLLSSAQENSVKASGSGFKVPEYNENGKLSCIISGQKGTIFGKYAKLEDVTVEIFHKDSPLKLTTPECIYNTNNKTCTSKEAVLVKGDGVKITGVGFDIDNQSKKIFIRSQVKVIWKKAKLKAETPKDSKETEK